VNIESILTKNRENLKENASTYLDFIRGISAIIVVLSHLRNTFFVTITESHLNNIFVKLFYAITGLGHQAVVVFFVLSGYLIATSIFNLIQAKWSWEKYLTNRLVRLFVVLIPALFLTYILDYSTINFLHNAVDKIQNRLSIGTFLGNLFFLQGIFVPTFGSNDPLWSLSYEFWYYMIFPCLLMVLFSKKIIVKLAYLCISFLLLWFIGLKMQIYFLIWLMGAIIVILPKLKITNHIIIKIFKTISVLALIVACGVSRMATIGVSTISIQLDMVIGVILTFLIYQLLHYPNNKPKSSDGFKIFKKSSQIISGFSYTIYLLHMPIIIFAYSLVSKFGFSKLQFSITNVLIFILMLLGIIGISYSVSLFTESKTNIIKKNIVDVMHGGFNYKKIEQEV